MSKSQTISMAAHGGKMNGTPGVKVPASKPNNLTSTKPYTPVSGSFHKIKC